ncbi:molybdenum ABC transporter ATP-binding protein [Agarivorans sp. QJM3NY_33]|uniref:molybdenum ABC transporter ATP-binding protein n=1 Tax=Agarivorans sp. QJM3NY_33 TaxID=3421432 RepID=UPI003D7DD1EE
MTQIQVRFVADRGDFCLDVNMTFPSQGVTVLFGPSGSGKTTCLRAMAGLERLPQSYFAVNGEVWQDHQTGQFVPTYQRDIAYVFQEASLFPHLNVQQNLLFGYKRLSADKQKLDIGEVSALLGITELLQRHPRALSGGERQRVAIARALLTSPKLLLMDEPLSALDLSLKQEIMPYLERLHQQLAIPIVYVSHSLDEVARLADHVVVLNQGRVVLQGRLEEVMLNELSGPLFSGQTNTLLTGRVVANHEHGLTQLTVNGLAFYLVGQNWQPGETVRCRINARDVSICRVKPQQSSILNVFPAEVQSIHPGLRAGECLVKAKLSSSQLVQALISEYSVAHLQLKLQQQVWLQIKSVAIL